jgi:excinuclease ABC subunit B
MYADTVTGSMQRAIDETNRRRARQIEFNAVHGITPRTIEKGVQDIMEGAHAHAARARGRTRVAEQGTGTARLSPADLTRELERLEKQMYRHARELEFEEAAKLRDEILRLKRASLGPEVG